MQKASLFLIIISIITNPSFSQSNINILNFQKNIDSENASIGICIEDISGKEVLSFNKKQSLTPASILKVVTSATALEILGENHRFKTEIGIDTIDKHRITIHGYGDPTLGSEYIKVAATDFIDKWGVEILKQTNASPLTIKIDDSYFGYYGVSRKWIREDMGNYYAAASYGISVFDNSYKLFFNTTNKKSPPPVLRTEPEMSGIVFTNSMGLNKTGNDYGHILGEPFSNNRFLMGSIPEGKASFSIKGDIPDPGYYLGTRLSDYLREKGIVETNVITTRSDYYSPEFEQEKAIKENDKIIHTHFSPPLSDIIRVVNVRSNNHYAEHLIRHIGRSVNPAAVYSDPLSEGIERINSFWASKGISTDGLFMYDGSGLSPSNAVNPALMCNILRYMYNDSKYSEAFVASFPKAGSEGTVRNLLKGTRLEGKVFVKSGSIANVQCYAGYYLDGDKKYAFAIMVNHFKKNSRRQVVKAIESLLLAVF